MAIEDAAAICRLIASSALHRSALDIVRGLALPDCWIGAGFVRSAVWDRLHGFTTPTPLTDIDVIWFDADRADPSLDDALTARLKAIRPDLPWSVKNQARMHERNGDPPYRSSSDAVWHWPETATAVAISSGADGALPLLAPFGVDDLLAMIVRPTPHFRAHRPAAYRERLRRKQWRKRWPNLTVLEA